MIKTLASALTAFVFAAPHVWAAPATEDGAVRLTGAFRTYLGALPDVVSVRPEGESYAAIIDLTPVIGLGRDSGLTGEASRMNLTLTDLGGGRWQVVQADPFRITLNAENAFSYYVEVGSIRLDGIFDEALMTFERSEVELVGMRVEQAFQQPGQATMDISYSVGEMRYTSAAAPSADGGVDVTMTGLVTDMEQTMRMPAAPGGSPAELTFAIDQYGLNGAVEGARSVELYDLLVWFIAHPSEAAIEADLPVLKSAVGAALPVFEDLRFSGDLSGVSVRTPFGDGGAEHGRFEIELNGAVRDGRIREMVALDGLTLPVELMPEWVVPLLPESVRFDVSLEGYDLAALADLLLESITKPEGTRPTEAELQAAFMPDGRLTVAFGETGGSSALYDLTAVGEITAPAEGDPEGRATIEMKGIAAVLEALNDAPEEIRQGAVPGLMMMRGIGKPAGDDIYTWAIEMSGPEKVIVNGIDMSAMSRQQ